MLKVVVFLTIAISAFTNPSANPYRVEANAKDSVSLKDFQVIKILGYGGNSLEHCIGVLISFIRYRII